MKLQNVPSLSPLYWATLAAASVFGTNTGDILSHTLHLGNYAGLPVLALLFAAIIYAERRAPAGGTLYYWLAVIVLRTAATNIADLATLQFELDYGAVILAVAVLLGVVVVAVRSRPAAVARRRARLAEPTGILSSSGVYWSAMLAAATLGTALGDFGAHMITLRVSTLITVGLLALAFSQVRRTNSDTPLYWLTIVLARAAGTNVGDLIAFKKGLNLGLPASSLLTGLVFFGLVWAGNRRGRVAAGAGQAARV